MPHQCVRCGELYDDGANELLKGCSNCSAKLFFYITKEKLEKQKNKVKELSKEEREEIENDINDIIGSDNSRDEPIILDLESVNLSKPGKYEVDLVHLFKKDPIVFKSEEGKYHIDISSLFDSDEN